MSLEKFNCQSFERKGQCKTEGSTRSRCSEMDYTIWRCSRSEKGWQTETEIAGLQSMSRSTQAVKVWEIQKQPHQDKWKVVPDQNLCIKCLQSGHFARDCPKTQFKCQVDGCNRDHNTLLHPPAENPSPPSGNDGKEWQELIPAVTPVEWLVREVLWLLQLGRRASLSQCCSS